MVPTRRSRSYCAYLV